MLLTNDPENKKQRKEEEEEGKKMSCFHHRTRCNEEREKSVDTLDVLRVLQME